MTLFNNSSPLCHPIAPFWRVSHTYIHFIGLSREDVYLKVLRKYYKWEKVLITFRKLEIHKETCPTTSLSSSVLTYKANSHCTDRRRPTPTENSKPTSLLRHTNSSTTARLHNSTQTNWSKNDKKKKTSFGNAFRLSFYSGPLQNLSSWLKLVF